MRSKSCWLAVLLALAATAAQAADKNYNVKYRLAVMGDNGLTHETRRQIYGFRVEIVDDMEGIKPEASKYGRPFITAAKGENYSVRLYNPLPVRVAVNLTVDGLNSITGKPCGITDGEKWMIDPYSSVTIPGWQVSGADARRFFFTDKPKSYAKWRGDMLGKDLSANCGVIGAAYFWNQQELDQYYDEHPIYRYTHNLAPYSGTTDRAEKKAQEAPSSAGAGAPAMQNDLQADQSMAAPVPQEQAGTGMGDRESHPTYQVSFDYDTGMYSLNQAVVIYYDFAKTPAPNPFPDLSYSPEMP